MSKLLRYYSEGQYYFITAVTYQRKRILLDNPEIWIRVLDEAKNTGTFDLIAWVLMQDHFHLIIYPKKSRPDQILKQIKLKYSFHYRKTNGLYRCKIWQARFWDHVIRNQEDFNRHVDYIHYNPVKHNYINSPFDWEYSTIGKYYDEGYYSLDWGAKKKLKFDGAFGE